jgi:hypothetical protein
MNDSLRFHQRFAARILQAVGVAALAVPVVHPLACGGTVVVDGEPESQGGQGGQGGASTSQSSASSSSQGPMSSSAAFASSSGDGSSSASGSTGSGPPTGTQCFPWPDKQQCPIAGEAASYMPSCVPETDYQYPTVVGGPVQYEGFCCYDVYWLDCGKVGRPFSDGGAARTAEARTSARP